MAKKQREPIRVEAYVTIDGKDYNLDEMSHEQKSFVGAHLKINYLNAIYAGKAVFSADLPDVKDVFPA